MKKSKVLISTLCLIFTLGLIGCAQQPKSANSQEAIQQANNLKTAEEKIRYLVKEANAFISSEKFNESIRIAEYILARLDKDSTDAKSILEKAKAELKAFAEKKAAEAQADVKKKLGSFGQ